MVERHEPPRGVDERIDDGQLQLVPFGDRGPVVHAGPAQRVRTDPHAVLADHVDIDDVRQVGDVAVHVVVALGGLQRRAPTGSASPRTPRPRRISLARLAIALVASVSAGPPLGGLYLKPPS